MKDGFYKIKTWKAMEKEFGLSDRCNINCNPAFSTYMEKAMSTDRTIEIRDSTWTDGEGGYWFMSEDMIESEITPPKSGTGEVSPKSITSLKLELQELKNIPVESLLTVNYTEGIINSDLEVRGIISMKDFIEIREFIDSKIKKESI